jgi:hypothetical protein
MIRNLPNIKPGDWITYKKGKSKSLHRGFSYRVEHDLSVHGIKGRGLTFEPTEAPIPYSGDPLRPNSSRLSDWLKNLLPEYSQQIEEYAPNNHAKELMVYINHANKRVPMTPGKAFRKIFNNFPDMGVETLVDLYKNEFGPEELTFHRSKDPDAFSQVYRMPKSTKRSNFMTTIWNKSLANSCMQKKYPRLKHHPAYAYGSGDFEILWGENKQGQLACRAIILSKYNVHFPKYATSKTALGQLTDCLDDLPRAESLDKDAHARFRLEKPSDDYWYRSCYLMPYVDSGYPVLDEGNPKWVADWNRNYKLLYPGTCGYISI